MEVEDSTTKYDALRADVAEREAEMRARRRVLHDMEARAAQYRVDLELFTDTLDHARTELLVAEQELHSGVALGRISDDVTLPEGTRAFTVYIPGFQSHESVDGLAPQSQTFVYSGESSDSIWQVEDDNDVVLTETQLETFWDLVGDEERLIAYARQTVRDNSEDYEEIAADQNAWDTIIKVLVFMDEPRWQRLEAATETAAKAADAASQSDGHLDDGKMLLSSDIVA